MKKGSYTVQCLVFLGMSLMCAVWTLICFGCSILQASYLLRIFLPVVGSIWILADVSVVMLRGRDRKWCLLLPRPTPSTSENAISHRYTPRRVNSLSLMSLRHSSDYTVCPQVACLPLLRSRAGSRMLSQASLLTFETPVFKSHWLQKLIKISHSHFPYQWLWGSVIPV